MKDGINPLTNAGECSDSTYKKAMEKTNRNSFFYAFCRRVFRLANKHLVKRHNIRILKIVFWDMETNNKKVMKVGKYE